MADTILLRSQLHQQLPLVLQLEEEIQEDLKWCIEVKEVLHSGQSEFQTMELVRSGPFGKVCPVFLGRHQRLT